MILSYLRKIIIFAGMKQAIIMGASSGMGREVARILIADGWRIGVAARRQEALEDLKLLNPAMVETAQIDVQAQDAPTLLLGLIGRVGGMQLYFHASGIGRQNQVLDERTELDTVETNALGFTRMIGAAFRYMADGQGGRIACISSIAGTKGLGPAPSYSATKAFQNTYIQALEQLAKARHLPIQFSDIRPGFVATPLLSGGSYPLQMDAHRVARKIVKAIYRGRHVQVIDWRYRILTALWRLVPNWIWRHIRLS